MIKLVKIHVKNYRSIKDLALDIPSLDGKQCLMFFGINETGKSNLIRAMSLLDRNRKFNYEKDCEKGAKKQRESVVITYFFELDSLPVLSNLTLPESLIKNLQIPHIQKKVVYGENSQRVEEYDIQFGKKLTYDKYVFNPSTNIVQDVTELKVNSFEELSEELRKTHQKLNDALLKKVLLPTLQLAFDKEIPQAIFWESSHAFLINQPINLDTFKSNPETSVPLKNIFLLTDMKGETLTKNIDRIRGDSDERSEMETLLSEAATKHINTLWPEHKVRINVRIEKDGLCEVSVSDQGSQARFQMDERSDGFKQFISILLTLSAENRKETLKNKLILLDEPERSLHPSSVRYLRDELLNISKNNIVLLSSHSLFMVDKKNLGRHYTVRKEKNQTEIEQVNPNNPFKEEVIYEALGTSIYELIEPYMIIFEGNKDKLLFELFTNKFIKELNPENVRAIAASGAKEIPKYVKFFDQKTVTALVVVDSDQEGKNAKETIVKANPDFRETTFEITDLVAKVKNGATLEDLLPEDIVLEEAAALYQHTFANPQELPILEYISKVKRDRSINTDFDLEELKQRIIRRIQSEVTNGKTSELKTKYRLYLEFLSNLHKKVKDLQKSR